MDHRPLGRTGLRVPTLGLGTGGANVFGQARGSAPGEARTIVRAALDLGVDYFDTAAAYGEAEVLLADALEGIARSDYLLATKYQPRFPNGTMLTASDVEAAIERSLRRLRTDVIDVYQVHALKAVDLDKVGQTHLPVLVRARDAGRIRAIGVTELFAGDDPHHETLLRALDDRRIDVLMVGYNVLHQNAEREVLPRAAVSGVGVVVMAAVRRALASRESLQTLVAELKASGDIDPGALADDDPLGWLVHDGTASVQAACYRYVVGHPGVSTVLTGTFDPAHLAENVAAIERGALPAGERDRLRALFGNLDRGLGR